MPKGDFFAMGCHGSDHILLCRTSALKTQSIISLFTFQKKSRTRCSESVPNGVDYTNRFLPKNFLATFHQKSNFLHSSKINFGRDPNKLHRSRMSLNSPNRTVFLGIPMLIPHYVHLPTNLTCTQRKYRGLWRLHEHCESKSTIIQFRRQRYNLS